ncbi:hypothetical protein [Haladaptatus sp. DFWS20]|uniref:hypothetical protein n=1 Tax=Haladaptatus sp. DFWS20 TaxID=3403467 RepID=UPI003EBED3B1
MNLPRSAVLKYYCFRTCISIGFIAPIWVLFVKSKGLSYTEIILLDRIWGVGLVLGGFLVFGSLVIQLWESPVAREHATTPADYLAFLNNRYNYCPP